MDSPNILSFIPKFISQDDDRAGIRSIPWGDWALPIASERRARRAGFSAVFDSGPRHSSAPTVMSVATDRGIAKISLVRHMGVT